MQTSTNNTATIFCYSAPLPSPANRGLNFGNKNLNLWKSYSTCIALINSNEAFSLNSRIISLLNEISSLQNNWDEEGALAPIENTIQKAYSLVYLLEKRGQQIFNVAPGPNGEIMLDIRNNKKTKSIEVIFYSNKSIVVQFPENDKPTQSDYYAEEIPKLISWLDQK